MHSTVRDLTREALEKRAAGLRREIFEMKIKRGFGQLENTSLPREKRRELARLLTVSREDALGLRPLKGTRTALDEAKERKSPAKAAQVKPSDEAPAAASKSKEKEATKGREEARKSGKTKGFFDRFRFGRRSGTRGQ